MQKGTRKKAQIRMSVQAVKDLLHMNPNIRTQELVVASGFSESAIVRWRLDILGEQSRSRLLSQARALADTVPAAMGATASTIHSSMQAPFMLPVSAATPLQLIPANAQPLGPCVNPEGCFAGAGSFAVPMQTRQPPPAIPVLEQVGSVLHFFAAYLIPSCWLRPPAPLLQDQTARKTVLHQIV